MKKLIIHQPTNHESKRFRYYNIFWDNLINELSKKHDVVVDRYYKRAHMGSSSVDLQLIEDNQKEKLSMLECEMVIENLTDKEIQVLSVSDDLTSAILNLQSHPYVKKIFVSQFIRDKIFHHVREENRQKYHPWIYFPSNEFDLEHFYNIRKSKEDFIDKMYFRGAASYRPILNYLSQDFFQGGDSIGPFEPYAHDLINYKVALSLAGRGEICYRDVECMAMGVPMIRFEYLSEFNSQFLPNIHYISIDRPSDLMSWFKLDREGEKHHADMITNKFVEIKGNKEFLDFISKNARKYYEDFLSPSSSVQHTLNLLDL